ncbi:MAG: GH3 auxin-responsive promoter family protein [Bacteroidales bacterium]|nr:GH3 auxin-responsive promoter family protein [Bacteroidales bacterium]
MDLLSTLARLFLRYRVRAIKKYADEGDAIQRRTLKMLVREARNTQWGREHGYGEIESYEDFAARVPIGNYSSHKPYITRMMEGTPDVLWKGLITRYATSSGTTSDVVKFIPVSKHGLNHSHLRGGRDVTATYLDQNRESHVGSGYSMILSGGFNPKFSTGKIKVGDISAIMAAAAPSFYRKLLHLVPPLRVAQMEDIHAKYDAITDFILRKNLVAFSGQPTWNIMVLEMAMQKAGVKSAEELWPNMELFAHGGMSLVPYRHKLEALFPSGKLHLIENYNASEGFFGIQTDMQDPAMTLMLDYGNFYEFVPMKVYGKPEQYAVPVWETEIGTDYAILVSTSSGLWRYDMGDVVRFTGRKPYRFVIVGRTHQNISLWGEDLSVQQAEKAMEAACKKCGAKVKEFTVAPVFLQDKTSGGYHQWLVEFTEEPADIEAFADTLDTLLQEEDFDYEHFRHRTGGGRLEMIKARPGLFYDWLDSKGKLGGQHKIPRLSSTRKYIDELLKLNI